MITDSVIKEIYKKFSKPHKRREDLQLEYFIPMLQQHHSISIDQTEIILEDLEEFNPFRRFLIRSLNAILEFDKMIAFVVSHSYSFPRKGRQPDEGAHASGAEKIPV